MAGYTDPHLVHNSSLACFLLTAFVKRYQECGERAPAEISKLLLLLPLLWHQASCAAIEGRMFSTQLKTVLADSPVVRIDFQRRVEAFVAPTLQGLNLACAAGLMKRTVVDDQIFLECIFSQWPRGSKPLEIPGEMARAIDRIAPWFAEVPAAHLYHNFLKE